MTTQSDLNALSPSERKDFGFARVRDAAFDAVMSIWKKRQREGMTQLDLANALDVDPAQVSKSLRGPGNWTLRTFGSLVEALDGEVQITVRPHEAPMMARTNFHAYAGYEIDRGATSPLSAQQMKAASNLPITRSPVGRQRISGSLLLP